MRRLAVLTLTVSVGVVVSFGQASAALGTHTGSGRLQALAKAEAARKACTKNSQGECKLTPTTTTTTLPFDRSSGYSTIASAYFGHNVAVYTVPGATKPSRTVEGLGLIPTVFLVKHRRGRWLQVYLPEPPNGSTGWIKARDVAVTFNPYRIRVELGAHRITVYKLDAVVLQEVVAVGAPLTPTPTGVFFVRFTKRNADGDLFGPYTFGLSAFRSNVLDMPISISGNDDPGVILGEDTSNGSIQLSNDGITRLALNPDVAVQDLPTFATFPLPSGTSVEIVP